MGLFRLSRSKYSKCIKCPLREKNKVWGDCSIDTPKIAIIGEAPGADEDRDGMPFVGQAGKFFIRAATIAGLKWNNIYKTNVICCRPPRNDINSYEAQIAEESCKSGLVYEVRKLLEQGVKVFLLAGNTPMHAFGIPGKISKNRGSVYVCKVLDKVNKIETVSKVTKDTFVAIPTYHPSFIMRGQWKEEVTWINDLEKAHEISQLKKYNPPREDFNIFPTLKDVKEFKEEVIKNKSLIGVDIETSGLDPRYSKIVVVGLASSDEKAISIPFLKQGFEPYWSQEEELTVSTYLNEILSTCPTIFQNALFDVSHLRSKGYQVNNIEHDIMLLHHAIHPELPHNLGYIVSVYGKTPYWKDIVLRSEELIKNLDDEEFRTYNLRDSVVLHQVLKPMLKHLKEVGTEDVYFKTSMNLIDPILTMQENGIMIDQKRLTKFKKDLEKEEEELLGAMYGIGGIDKNINFNSGEDLRLLLYGIQPTKYARAKEEWAEYQVPESRKKKESKKYKNIEAIIKACEQSVPLYQTRATKRKSDAGNLKTDGETRLNIRVAANNRLRDIDNLKDSSKKKDEVKEIKRLTDFLDLFEKYQRVKKLLSTYTSFPVDEENRVHFKYLIHGTNTGRLSSRG